jgi:hypothetical protein
MKVTPEITINVYPENIPVRGNIMASGDDQLDKEVEDEVLRRLEMGDVWAWCCVEIVAEYRGVKASTTLGGCSYLSEDDFIKNGGYYDDLVWEVTQDLRSKIGSLQGVEVAVVEKNAATEIEHTVNYKSGW